MFDIYRHTHYFVKRKLKNNSASFSLYSLDEKETKNERNSFSS